MPARTVIGYGKRKFHIFADMITSFLVNCDKAGLHSIADVSDSLDAISELVVDSKCADAEQLKRHLRLLRELDNLVNGAISEEL